MGDNSQTYNPSAADATLQAPPNSDPVSQFMSFLQNSYQKAQNANTGSNSDSGNSQLPPAHQAAVDGAIQGIKKAASEAAYSGGLDVGNHIIQSAIMSGATNGFGGQQPAPLDMNSLNQNNQPQPSPSQQNVDSIGQRAIDIVTPQQGFHPLGALLNAAENWTGINQINATAQGINLRNLAEAQRIVANQPSEIALPQAQAQHFQALRKQTEQQIAGLTPEQKATAIETYNSALLNQHENLQKSITEQMTSTATAIDQLVKNTPLLNKAPLSPYYDVLGKLQDRLQGLSDQGKGVIKSFKSLQLTNPVTGEKSNSQGNPNSFSVGDKVKYNGKSYTYKGTNPKTGKAILE